MYKKVNAIPLENPCAVGKRPHSGHFLQNRYNRLVNHSFLPKKLCYFTAARAAKRATLHFHYKESVFRAIYSCGSLVMTFFASTFYSDSLIHLICTPFSTAGECAFIFTDLTEGFYTAINVSFLVSFCLCTPLWIYQWWCFLIPSCYCSERRSMNGFLFFAAVLFLMSLFCAYGFILPKICAFCQQFQVENALLQIKLQARIAPAVRWSCTSAFLIAVVFQIPLFFAFLLNAKLVESKFLCKNRKYAFFFLWVLAGLLSPPDLPSQCILAISGCALYETCLWFALFHRLKSG